jgi:hypothetical protein
MNIDQFHDQMNLEANRLADHVFAYCDVDPRSSLAGEVRDLEVGELVALFYLIAHERLLLENALTQFEVDPGYETGDDARVLLL